METRAYLMEKWLLHQCKGAIFRENRASIREESEHYEANQETEKENKKKRTTNNK